MAAAQQTPNLPAVNLPRLSINCFLRRFKVVRAMPRIDALAQMLGAFLVPGDGASNTRIVSAASHYSLVDLPPVVLHVRESMRDDCLHRNFVAFVDFDESIPASRRATVKAG